MIYITGDCHGDFGRFNGAVFPEKRRMTRDDYVIICGDFGGVWSRGGESRQEADILDWLESMPFTLLFVDGNHENFDRLATYPVEVWNGGKVHRVRPHVLHLMRGQVFTIDGVKIFCFGGAASHDIEGGILEPVDPLLPLKKSRLNKAKRLYRINHVSWWQEELPSLSEMTEARRNLAACANQVDFIVTHCCATGTQKALGLEGYETNHLTNFLEEVKQNCQYTKWFFGHYHDNRNVGENEIMIYEQIIRIV